jgi:hypothetical protein
MCSKELSQLHKSNTATPEGVVQRARTDLSLVVLLLGPKAVNGCEVSFVPLSRGGGSECVCQRKAFWERICSYGFNLGKKNVK